MAQPYVGSIRMFAGLFEPNGWRFCHGQVLSINLYPDLFDAIGKAYGGDGEESFALPDLRSRVLVHHGTLSGGGTYQVGETGGVEQVTLAAGQIPAHTHSLNASTQVGSSASPAGKVLATSSGGISLYYEGEVDSAMHTQSLTPFGGNQPHENVQPWLGINYIIAVFGVTPNPG